MSLQDYIVIGSAGITVTFTILSLVFLGRYRSLVSASARSEELSKNLWDAFESRVKKQDERIIDVMTRLDVLGTRYVGTEGVTAPVVRIPSESRVRGRVVTEATLTPERTATTTVGDLDRQILQLLATGPRTSNEIRGSIGRSREHVARLMKGLFESGYVIRNDAKRPFVYEISQVGKRYLGIDAAR